MALPNHLAQYDELIDLLVEQLVRESMDGASEVDSGSQDSATTEVGAFLGRPP
jgi:hypothetical protein